MKASSLWAVGLVVLAASVCAVEDGGLAELGESSAVVGPRTLAEAVMRIGELKARLQTRPTADAALKGRYGPTCKLGQAVMDMSSTPAQNQLAESNTDSSSAAAKEFDGMMPARQKMMFVMKLMQPLIGTLMPDKWKMFMLKTTQYLLLRRPKDYISTVVKAMAIQNERECGERLLQSRTINTLDPAFAADLPESVSAILRGDKHSATVHLEKLATAFIRNHAEKVLEVKSVTAFGMDVAPHVRQLIIKLLELAIAPEGEHLIIEKDSKPEDANDDPDTVAQLGESAAPDVVVAMRANSTGNSSNTSITTEYKPVGFGPVFFDAVVKFLAAVVPGMLVELFSGLPKNMAKAGAAMRATLTALSRDVIANLEVYPVPVENRKAVVELLLTASRTFYKKFSAVSESLAEKVLLRKLSRAMRKMPRVAQDILATPIKLITVNDLEGAAAALPAAIAKYGIAKLKQTARKIAPDLPAYARGTVVYSLHTFLDLFKPEGSRLPMVDVSRELIVLGIKIVFGVMPGLIDAFVAKLPKRLNKMKAPLTDSLNMMNSRVKSVLIEMEAKWNDEGMKEIAQGIMSGMYDLAVRADLQSSKEKAADARGLKGGPETAESAEKSVDGPETAESVAKSVDGPETAESAEKSVDGPETAESAEKSVDANKTSLRGKAGKARAQVDESITSQNTTKGEKAKGKTWARDQLLTLLQVSQGNATQGNITQEKTKSLKATLEAEMKKKVETSEEKEIAENPISMVRPLAAKLPEKYQSIFLRTLPEILRGKLKTANTKMEAGLVKYGVDALAKVVAQGCSELPNFMKEGPKVILEAIMGVVSKYAETIAAAYDSGNSEYSFTDIDSASYLFLQTVKIVKAVVPAGLKHVVEGMPESLSLAKGPMDKIFGGLVKQVLSFAQDMGKWNQEGAAELADIIIRDAALLKDPFKASQLSRHRTELFERVKPILLKLPKGMQDVVRTPLSLMSVGDTKGAGQEMDIHIADLMLEKVKRTIATETDELPSFAAGPAKTAFMDIVRIYREPDVSRTRVAKKIMENMVTLVKRVLPSLISIVVANIPKRLWKARAAVKAAMTNTAAQVLELLNQGSHTWRSRSMRVKIAKTIIDGATSLAAIANRWKWYTPSDDEEADEDDFDATRSSFALLQLSKKDAEKEDGESIADNLHLLTDGLPGDFTTMIEDVVSKLEEDNVEGAVASLKKRMLEHAVTLIEPTAKDMTSKLPPYIQGPMFSAITDILKEETSQLQRVDAYMTEGYDIGEGKEEAHDCPTMLLQNGIRLVGGVLPTMIQHLVRRLPRGNGLRDAKFPLRKQLTKLVNKVNSLIGGGKTSWKKKQFGGVVEAVILFAKHLARDMKKTKEKLRVVRKISPEILAMPKNLVHVFLDPVESLVAGDVEGAVQSMDHAITKYLIANFDDVLGEFCSKLPKFVATPLKIAVRTVVTKQATMMGMDDELGEAQTNGGYLSMASLLIGDTVTVLKATVPTFITELVADLPENLMGYKVPVQTALTNICNDIADILSEGASMWGEKGANEIALVILKHARFLSEAAGKEKKDSSRTKRSRTKGSSTVELGQEAPRPQPLQPEVMSVASSGPQLMPHRITVTDEQTGPGEVQLLGGLSLGESSEVDAPENSQDPEEAITPLLKEMPHEFRTMLQLAFTKILLKESANAAEELKKGISDYAETKADTTVSNMAQKLPTFMRNPAKRAIMSVVKKQVREYAGEGPGVDPPKVLLEAAVSLFRGVMPGVIKGMGEHLAFGQAKGIIPDVVKSTVMKILSTLQRGPWDNKAKSEIVETVISAANQLMRRIKVAMKANQNKRSRPRGTDEQDRLQAFMSEM